MRRCRSADRAGDTVDLLLTAKRDQTATRRFQERAINEYGVPENISIDNNGANTAPIQSPRVDACVDIVIRRNKYRNNLVERGHRAINGVSPLMLGFKSL